MEFLRGIADLFSSIADFIIGFVQDLLYAIELVGETVIQLPSYFTWIPAEVYALLGGIFAIVVIYKILGREG